MNPILLIVLRATLAQVESLMVRCLLVEGRVG